MIALAEKSLWHFAALHSTAQHIRGTWKLVFGNCIGSEIQGQSIYDLLWK
jgi:hypothetical protein